MMNIAEYNRRAWVDQVEKGNRWTVPVTSEIIASAESGLWSVVLTPRKAAPTEWLPCMIGF